MLAALAVAAAACGERHHVDHRVWTLFDIQQALHEGGDEGGNVAMGATLPDGLPASSILTRGNGFDTLAVTPCFAEGQPAAFVTTELWINYDEVWVEPGYVQITNLSKPDPFLRYGDGARAPVLFDVGPKSAFYSPFWNLQLAEVGELSDADHFRSTRALREEHVPILPLEPHACPLRPLDVPVLGAAPGTKAKEPTWQTELDDIPSGTGWIDGQKVGIFDLGAGIFHIDERPGNGLTVQPLPFFVFLGPDGAGGLRLLPGALRVGGVGALFSGVTVPAGDGDGAPAGFSRPPFGAFWRVHTAVAPASAGAFMASQHAAAAPTGVDLKDYEGRVALDAACFDAADFPAGCAWLDSQAKIEAALGAGNLAPTEIMGTCPFVFYNKKPVKR